MEDSRAGPSAYLCGARCWWATSKWELGERLKLQHLKKNYLSNTDLLQPTLFPYFAVGYLKVQTWSFTPVKEKVFTLKPILTLWPLQYPEHENIHLHLEVTGTGSVGFIQVRQFCICIYLYIVFSFRAITIVFIGKGSSPWSRRCFGRRVPIS